MEEEKEVRFEIIGVKEPKEYYIPKGVVDQVRTLLNPYISEKYNVNEVLTEIVEKSETYYITKDYNAILTPYLKYMKEILGQYTDRLENVTMMIKILRKSYSQTTNRKIHSAAAAKIGRDMAEKIGVNPDLTEVMLKIHDNGHTPYGHDGEQWISDALQSMGLGFLWHNAEGTRRLLYRENFYEKVIEKIKEENPDIKPWHLEAIRENLWVILDGVLTHNGEATGRIFEPVKKDEKEFQEELLRCYTEEGEDKKIMPATIEGCLLRISDIISYAGRDFVDGIREKIITEVDSEYISIFKDFGITSEELRTLIDSQNYEEIARRIEEAAKQDVVANSDKTKIEMSQEMAEKLYRLRQKNNRAIVSKVTRETERNIFPMAIKNIIKEGKKILVEEGVISKLESDKKFEITEELKQKYPEGNYIRQLLTFAEGVTESDYEFSSKIADCRKEGETGEKISKPEAIAALITSQFIASMTDLEFVKYLRESGNLAPKQEKDLHKKYEDIPGIATEQPEMSEFMKKTMDSQEEGLKELMLNGGSEAPNSGASETPNGGATEMPNGDGRDD